MRDGAARECIMGVAFGPAHRTRDRNAGAPVVSATIRCQPVVAETAWPPSTGPTLR